VADTAAFVAELRGEPVEELAAATTANFHRLFLGRGREGADPGVRNVDGRPQDRQ
jgi:hypothetical protein